MIPKNFFGTRRGIISTGVIIGALAAVLQYLGNPKNMGICVACMERDIAGALGLHRADVVQYIRLEIVGFVLGALLAALIFRELRFRGGSSPLVRFILGVFAMIGALVFLGCPWRALLRLAGGDGNAILGLAGLTAGVGIGVLFLKSGYNLGRSSRTSPVVGWILPVFMLFLLFLSITRPPFIFWSEKGPGSQHAPFLFSLAAGLIVGFIAQRSRFCTMGAIRDMILFRDSHLFSGIVALTVTALIINLFLGQFKAGFANQPIAHTAHIWNFLGMVLAGLAFTLAGGCPGRQLILSGEGDGDASVFVLGMIFGAGFSHNFTLASSPKGPGPFGPIAVITGLIICLLFGFLLKTKESHH
ncbi:MAG: YedE family putative selenium transporter [bacterium]